MEVWIAPDKFQEQMSALMNDLEFVRVYLNDLFVITSSSFEEHLAKVKEVMNRPQSAGIKLNMDKCKVTVPKVEYLGYIIMREGIKLDPEKSKQLSILNDLMIKNRQGSS